MRAESILIRHVRFISPRTLVECSWDRRWIIQSFDNKMGNILNRKSSSEDEIPTPKIVDLTPAEVEIIKTSWKIPSASVSAEMYI